MELEAKQCQLQLKTMGGGSFVVGIHLLKEGYYTGGRVSWGDYIERVGGEVEAAGG